MRKILGCLSYESARNINLIKKIHRMTRKNKTDNDERKMINEKEKEETREKKKRIN